MDVGDAGGRECCRLTKEWYREPSTLPFERGGEVYQGSWSAFHSHLRESLIAAMGINAGMTAQFVPAASTNDASTLHGRGRILGLSEASQIFRSNSNSVHDLNVLKTVLMMITIIIELHSLHALCRWWPEVSQPSTRRHRRKALLQRSGQLKIGTWVKLGNTIKEKQQKLVST